MVKLAQLVESLLVNDCPLDSRLCALVDTLLFMIGSKEKHQSNFLSQLEENKLFVMQQALNGTVLVLAQHLLSQPSSPASLTQTVHSRNALYLRHPWILSRRQKEVSSPSPRKHHTSMTSEDKVLGFLESNRRLRVKRHIQILHYLLDGSAQDKVVIEFNGLTHYDQHSQLTKKDLFKYKVLNILNREVLDISYQQKHSLLSNKAYQAELFQKIYDACRSDRPLLSR